jgi:hypothetical protein
MPNCTISFARFHARPAKRKTGYVTTAGAERDTQGRFRKRKPETIAPAARSRENKGEPRAQYAALPPGESPMNDHGQPTSPQTSEAAEPSSTGVAAAKEAN